MEEQIRCGGNEMQVIRFAELRKKGAEVRSSDVTLVPSPGDHDLGSAKVKLKKIVDFSWEIKLSPGQLLSIHMSRKYVAYGISGKDSWAVRVVDLITNERFLLKEVQGTLQDLAFAHIPDEVILACVDELGNLMVHAVQTLEKKMTCTLLLHIKHHHEVANGLNHRVIWCPFIPDDEEMSSDTPYEDVAKLLVMSCGNKVELYNMSVVLEYHGKGPFYPEEVKDGFVSIQQHTEPIVDATFSPDGAALATVSVDGSVKFFQVKMDSGEKPSCIHEWKPHNGKPVTSLFFLDNLQSFNSEVQFWKFAVTGADDNTEIKLWSCKSWTCLQTFRFITESSKKKIVMKAALDLKAGYLLLSDIYNKLLYVLQIRKDDEGFAFVRSISEFCMPCPVVSFCIIEAEMRRIWGTSIEALCADSDDDDDFDESTEATVIDMLLICPHSLQQCCIAFRPPPQTIVLPVPGNDSVLIDSSGVPQNFVEKSDSDPSYESGTRSRGSPLNLMTPDAFAGPPTRNSVGDSASANLSYLENNEIAELTSLSEASTVLLSPVNCPQENIQLLSPRRILETPPFNAFVPIEAAATGVVTSNEELEEGLLTCKPQANRNHQEGTLPMNKVISVDKIGMANTEVTNGDEQLQESLEFFSNSSKSVGHTSSQTQNLGNDNTVQLINRALSSFEDRLDSLEGTQQQLTSVLKDFEKKQLSSNSDLNAHLRAQIQELQAGLNELKIAARQSEMQASGAKTSDTALITRLENVLVQQSTHLQASMGIKFNELAQVIEERQRKHQEGSLNTISQVLGNVVSLNLNNIVMKEFNENLTPAVRNSVEPLTRQIHKDVIQKLSVTDDLLKDGMSKLVQSKGVLEVYRSSLTSVLEPLVKACFKESFQIVLLPSLQKCFNTMFQQLNDVFGKGTKEYVNAVDSHYSQYHQQQEKTQEVLKEVHDLADIWKSSGDSFAQSLCQEVQNQMQGQLKLIQKSVNKTVEEAVRDHIAKGFHAQKSVIEDSVVSAVRAQTMTPCPMVDTQVLQAQIMQLVAQGQLNSAFQQALQASDLNLVVHLCEKVNPAQVFNQCPCPLQQNVLLSLIQQLSADLMNHTELKHRYLEEAVMNLDISSALTREHLPVVLVELQRQLDAFVRSNPTHKLTRKMKMLHMAVKSFDSVHAEK